MRKFYHIGTVGHAWNNIEKNQWLSEQTVKRSFFDDVEVVIATLTAKFDVEKYGELDYRQLNGKTYPLYAIRNRNWQKDKTAILVTGGVHGYESSGVYGALRFLQTTAQSHSTEFNIVVLPCISPWSYETINRWNPEALDPNRHFGADGKALEAQLALHYVNSLQQRFAMHIDLHETTDTDVSEFEPAKAARDGTDYQHESIPDGFYLADDASHPCPGFQKAIIDSVTKVTHIAVADAKDELIGIKIEQPGVINLDKATLGLCASITDAPLVSTTEVYPDSPEVTAEQSILAQVAAVEGAIRYLKQHRKI